MSTKRYIAFLRAINVGGHTVKMDVLRQVFESLSLQNVETFIASGNVIFDAPAGEATLWEAEIAATLQRTLGYEVCTFIRSDADLVKISKYIPFDNMRLSKGGDTLHVGFVGGSLPKVARERLLEHGDKVDGFHVKGREIYWLRRRKEGESKFTNTTLERAIKTPVTMRNINTVQRLVAKYSSR